MSYSCVNITINHALYFSVLYLNFVIEMPHCWAFCVLAEKLGRTPYFGYSGFYFTTYNAVNVNSAK